MTVQRATRGDEMSRWQRLTTAPVQGHFLAADFSEGSPPLCVELVVGPFLADGRILNQNTGNYVLAGTFTHWTELPEAPIPSISARRKPPKE